ncbi:hypothetical protein CCO57_23645 [Salmonella enterica subsp. indica serovar Marseille]|nr:hypothetical protein [Salmonella enterica subsp. enterica]EAO9577024.1 hypothetical protein [Salmonella enterica]EBV0882032.1 hypothetical protein [Salmonella enterica subsp. enterica serovar Heidelberg]EBV2813021.1 hypothetical protein [Salmonella enterica subsp. enterica serovar Uganda]EBV4613488.1 hypothetical protein [Salmonella enterica subsp. enterica serovar Solt]EBV5359185.1 hypothetical protein [Salmonella enterica subsp. enterica serovar Saintpaul]EBW3575345.1 hypothetical protei
MSDERHDKFYICQWIFCLLESFCIFYVVYIVIIFHKNGKAVYLSIQIKRLMQLPSPQKEK